MAVETIDVPFSKSSVGSCFKMFQHSTADPVDKCMISDVFTDLVTPQPSHRWRTYNIKRGMPAILNIMHGGTDKVTILYLARTAGDDTFTLKSLKVIFVTLGSSFIIFSVFCP